ncbi:MAG: hypothetical protein F6J93_02475 [Oscillatoria sp. SIO1A7]|nr:hypothetical protein [Oscillatoria sp. SIO1A7]
MKWEELRKEALELSVSDRLFLVEAIVRSLGNELRPRPPVPEGRLTGLIGLLKRDESAPTAENIKEERIKEKYLQ